METLGEGFDEAKAQLELREIIIEQHQGKWIFAGNPADKAMLAIHEDFVRGRVNRGIELTAQLRQVQTLGKKKSPKGSTKSNSELAAALSLDLLS